MTAPCYVGVDGGGTKTRFVAIDGDGHVLAEHQGGTSYHLQVGVAGVRDVLAEGLAALSAHVAVGTREIAHAFFGLPAFGEDAAVDPVLAAMPAAIMGHRRYTCGNDMVCGWAGSLGCADGINIVAGTGSIGYGERGGRTARAGGWGEVFGDEGSGYWIAVEGLSAFAKASDGRRAKGALYEAIRAHFGLIDDIDMCSRIMGDTALSRQEVAALSPLVTDAALAGDAAASEICRRAADELAAIADAIRRHLLFDRDEAVALSFSGGILEHSHAVSAAFRDRLATAPANYVIAAPRYSPSYGAALYARRLSRAAKVTVPPPI